MTKKISLCIAALLAVVVFRGTILARITGTTVNPETCWGADGAEACVDSSGNVIPTTNNDASLGTSSLRFSNIFSVLGNFSGAITGTSLTLTTGLGTASIADGAVTSDKLASGSVTNGKLGADSVTSDKILAASIGASELVADAVTSDKIPASNIGSSEILADAVTSDKIPANNIGTSELIADAVTSDKIAAANVGTSDLAASAVTSDKMSLGTTSQNAALCVKAAGVIGICGSAVGADGGCTCN